MVDNLGIIFAFFAILLVVLWSKITRKHKVSSYGFEITRDKDGRLQRPLDNIERLFAMSGLDGAGVVVSSILLSSKVPLEPSLMRKTLVLVNKRFPLLRMAIYRDSDNTLWFKEMADPSRIAFRLCTNYTASQWVKVLESESRVDLDLEEGPLWKVTLLKEEYDNTQQLYTNSFVITVSHAIYMYDGMSKLAINSQVLQYLNELFQEKDIMVESRPLLPPATYLLRSNLQLSILEKVFFKVLQPVMSIKNMFVKQSIYLKIYPPPILHDPSIVKRTSLVARVISSEDLSKIVTIAKEHDCTIHSVITAATRLAMAKILKMGSTKNSSNDRVLPDPLKFSNSFNVAVRKYCEPEVGPNDVGCFVSIATMNIETPCYMSITPKDFWEYAQACKDAVTEKISNGEHFKMLKFLCSVNSPSKMFHKMIELPFLKEESNEGRFDGLFNISNLGRFTIGNDEKEGPFQAKGGYGATAEQRAGSLFSHNMMTINGVLYWGLSYFPHITTKQQAEEFIDTSISILKEGCQL